MRPRTEGTSLVQMDDLADAVAQRLRQVSFLVLYTRPGSFQAWVALAAPAHAEFARRLRKGAGAGLAASGVTRISDSLNVKEKNAPAFPSVQTVHACPGLVVTPTELDALGVVALPEMADSPDELSGKARENGEV